MLWKEWRQSHVVLDDVAECVGNRYCTFYATRKKKRPCSVKTEQSHNWIKSELTTISLRPNGKSNKSALFEFVNIIWIQTDLCLMKVTPIYIFSPFH